MSFPGYPAALMYTLARIHYIESYVLFIQGSCRTIWQYLYFNITLISVLASPYLQHYTPRRICEEIVPNTFTARVRSAIYLSNVSRNFLIYEGRFVLCSRIYTYAKIVGVQRPRKPFNIPFAIYN